MSVQINVHDVKGVKIRKTTWLNRSHAPSGYESYKIFFKDKYGETSQVTLFGEIGMSLEILDEEVQK